MTAYMLRCAPVTCSSEKAVQSWTSVTDLSPYALCAIIGAEDPAFFQHHGVSWLQVTARVYTTVRDRERIGAVSTITQQLARNLYLHEQRSIKRKLLEVLLARRLEAVLGKARILEVYVNVVEWGPGTWGIENAAQTYFGSTASALNPFQAVVLASLLPAPRAPLAGKNLARAFRSQLCLLHFLYGAGIMSLPQWRETMHRLTLLHDGLRAGRAASEVLRELGNRPYEGSATLEGASTAAKLLESRCGLDLRIAYGAVLRNPVEWREWARLIPQRWNGRLMT